MCEFTITSGSIAHQGRRQPTLVKLQISGLAQALKEDVRAGCDNDEDLTTWNEAWHAATSSRELSVYSG